MPAWLCLSIVEIACRRFQKTSTQRRTVRHLSDHLVKGAVRVEDHRVAAEVFDVSPTAREDLARHVLFPAARKAQLTPNQDWAVLLEAAVELQVAVHHQHAAPHGSAGEFDVSADVNDVVRAAGKRELVVAPALGVLQFIPVMVPGEL